MTVNDVLNATTAKINGHMRVLFVCVGNICRSPSAEGVFRNLLRKRALTDCIESDSAGTASYHVGEAPDSRSQQAARQRGYDLSAIRSRKLVAADFERFDLVLAMDGGVLAELRRLCPPAHKEKVHLFMDFSATRNGADVPDPYYGGSDGFERVLDMIEPGAQGVLDACLAYKRLPD